MHGTSNTDIVAQAFVAARRAGRALPDYPGQRPETLADAYAIQARAIALMAAPVAGWKVGRIGDALVDRYGANRLAGPIFPDLVVEAAAEGTPPTMNVFGEGFAAAEAEFLLRLGALPASFDREWTNDAVAAHVDEVRLGIEIASSPYPGINADGPAVTVSDFGNNHGLVIGQTISPESDFLVWPVALSIDGEVAGEGAASTMLDGPFGAVRFLFELAARGIVTLAQGQWISTGAVTGVHPVRPGARVVARFGSDRTVECMIGEGSAR
ncbi:2-keto-4-pentenoate hydratase [Sphingomonas sp. RS6]